MDDDILTVCETESGQQNLILDIEESRGERKSLTLLLPALAGKRGKRKHIYRFLVYLEMDQRTRPNLLPIVGNIDEEIGLQIASSTRPVFQLNGKQLQLTAPLDRDNEDISSVILQVTEVATSRAHALTVMPMREGGNWSAVRP